MKTLVEGMDNLSKDGERFVDRRRFRHSRSVVAGDLQGETELTRGGVPNAVTRTLLFSEPAKSTRFICPMRAN
jgi:hypothetical protein